MIHFRGVEIYEGGPEFAFTSFLWNEPQLSSHNKVADGEVEYLVDDAEVGDFLLDFKLFHGFLDGGGADLHDFADDKIFDDLRVEAE